MRAPRRLAVMYAELLLAYLKQLPKAWSSREYVADMIKAYENGTPEEIIAVAALTERCLRLDPRDRPSADDLLTDPW